MTNSYKELSIAEPLPFPTLLDLPSTTFLFLTITQVDEKLNTMTADVYNMCKFATELKQSILHLQCKVDFFRNYGVRELSLIRCIVENFGVNCYYFPKLVSCIRTCNSKWKRLLFKNIKAICQAPKPQEIFLYRTERNTYFLSMMRTLNTNIRKITQQLLSRGHLTLSIKHYLKSKGLMKYYQESWVRVIEVLQEKEEETSLKILLINEFIKYLLNFVHFCCNEKEEEDLFHKFYILSLYLCRILKKFYFGGLTRFIEDSFHMILSGFELYIETIEKRNSHSRIKMEQIRLVVSLIEKKKVTYHPTFLNENGFVIRLLIKILFHWKQVHNKSEKLRSLKNQSKPHQQFSFTTLMKKQKVKSIRSSLYNMNPSDIKLQTLKFSRSLSKLNRKKSINGKNGGFCSNASEQANQPLSSIKIRTEIEGCASRYFKRANSLYVSRGQSIQRRREGTKRKVNEEEKQLRLQDYARLYSSKSKVVPTINRIQLYQSDKMQNFYRNKPKAKLKLI